MPNKKPQVIYWDACLFIAWLKDEDRDPGEMAGLHSVAQEIHKGKKVLITSVQTQTEVLESRMGSTEYSRFEAFLNRSNVQSVPIDGRIASLAGKIRDHYLQTGLKIKTPDAIHLATAILYRAAVFHTFDNEDLIRLSGNVMNYNLLIEKPKSGQLGLQLKPKK